jgi:non-specific serine/threonine protein kinase
VRYLYFRWRVGESRDWFERALAAAPLPSVARARVLYGAGSAASYQGDHDRAVAYLDEALILARSYGEPVIVADTLFALGTEAEDRGEYECGRVHLSEALGLFLQAGDRAAAILTQYHLGIVAYGRGDHTTARAILEEARDFATAHGDDPIEIAANWYLALIAIDARDQLVAASALLRCLELCLTLSQPEGISRVLSIVATLASARDEPLLAARLFGAAAAVAEEIGYVVALPERARFDRARDAVRTVLGTDAIAAALDEGRRLSAGQAADEAMTFARRVIAADPPRTPASPIDLHPEATATIALTAREQEVLRLLADGRTNPEIAAALYITPGTARIHVSHILAKLDARTRTEAAAAARHLGLV